MNDREVHWSEFTPRLDALLERLDYIERHLVSIAQQGGYHYAPFTRDLPPGVAELIRAGKALEAAKRYRELTGASFEQARVAVAKATAGGI